MEMNSIADWERWVALFREDPEGFERERHLAIEELIMSQPERIRRRSRQLQWRIDAVRRRAPNNLASCIRIYDMMVDIVYGTGGLLDVIKGGKGRRFDLPNGGAEKPGICLKLKKPGNIPGSGPG